MARAAVRNPPRTPFRDYEVLLDDPASSPSGNFGAYAQALADIILHSRPRFAVGIFGSWGSGKTTLMQAIARQLKEEPTVVQVEFNAWRYEREEHLIVPLLDTLRESLAEWSRDHADKPEGSSARRAASVVGRTARALLMGLTLKAKVPFVGEASYDLSRVAGGFDEQAADEPSSLYHTSFRSLESAIAEFVANERRIVVFVDDLDRCLPASALEVLESMKLFFDLPGFVFVVGLDQSVIERSIEFKYGQPTRRTTSWPTRQSANGLASAPPESSLELNSPINGGEYIKKIFQVPFSLPPIARGDLQTFFNEIVTRANLPQAQRNDLRRTVVRHLPYLSSDDVVNPREVKRFVNAYTIQLKMLAPKLGGDLDPQVVLSLLVISFRGDWERMYSLLIADPGTFMEAVRAAGPDGAWIDDEPLPTSLLAYLGGPGSRLREATLEPYITSVEATQTSDRSLQTVQFHLSKLRRLVAGIAEQQPDAQRQTELHSELDLVRSSLLSRTKASPLVANALSQVEAVQLQVKELAASTSATSEDRREWATAARRRLDQVREIVVALRRQASTGGRTQ